MLKVNAFHICENLIIEDGTQKVSLIGIFENINAQNFPAVYPQVTIFAAFEGDKPGPYEIELKLSDKEGEILKTSTKIAIGENLRGNWFTKIPIFQIRGESTIEIILSVSNKVIHTGYITVNNKK